MSAIQIIKKEARKMFFLALYFFVWFLLILILKKLMLAQHHISVTVLSTAVIGALVVAKVVIVLEATPLRNLFGTRHPWLRMAVKALAYAIVVSLVMEMEKFIDAVRETDGIANIARFVWEHEDRNHTMAAFLCLWLAFANYNLLAAIDAALAPGGLRELVFGRQSSAPE